LHKEREEWYKYLSPRVSVGDKVRIVYLDGIIKPVKTGMIGIVARLDSERLRVYFPELGKFNTKSNPAIIYWYEIDKVSIASPIEQHLRKVIAG